MAEDIKVADVFGVFGWKIDKDSIDKVDDAIGKAKNALKAFFAFQGFKAVLGMVEEVAEVGGNLADAAQRTGLTAEAIQELGYAAKLSGSSVEGLLGSASKLGRNLDEALTKRKGPVVDALKSIGLSLGTPAVAARDLDGVLMLVAERFAKMPDGPKKIAIAMDLFGKSGAELIPTLNQGADGLTKVREEARRLGVVMSNETVGKLDDFGDNIDRAKMSIQGLKNQAIAALLPTLAEMLEKFLAWTQANREVISSSIQRVVLGAVSALQAFAKAVAFVVEHWQIFAALLAAGAVLQGITAIIRAVIWFRAEQTKAALMAIKNWIMILGPIALIVAAVVGLAYLIYRFRDKIGAAFKWVRDKAGEALSAIRRFGSNVVAGFTAFGQGIKQAFSDAFDWVINKAKSVGSTIRNLPVIKQFLDGVEWGAERAADVVQWASDDPAYGDLDAVDSVVTAPASTPPATPRRSTKGGGNGPSASIGPAKGSSPVAVAPVFHINGVTDPVAIGNIVDRRMRETMDSVFAEAEDEVS